MKKVTAMAIATAVAFGLASCASPYNPNGITNQQGGTVIGGVAGGLIGSQIGSGSGTVVAVIGGTLLGAFLGNRIGAYMDQQSQAAANNAAYRAFDTGRYTTWRTSTAYGSVNPHRVYMYQGHYVCRPFVAKVYMQGRSRLVHGTACKDRYGHWVVR